MKSTYVNATNVVAGRKEVMMLLGVNQAWQMNQEKVNVDIAERIVMTPYTAKRLAIMLAATLKAYEAKYGKIAGNPRFSVTAAPQKSVIYSILGV